MVMHTYNFSIWEAEAGDGGGGWGWEVSLDHIARPYSR
jgi:hypothetical protein